MTDDELVLIYKGLRDMTQAMKTREIALDAKTAALGAAIAQLGKIPETLRQQTSQYIATGVRQSIQDDFSRPIAEAVKGPIAALNQATDHARAVMQEVGNEARVQTWTGITTVALLGVIVGIAGSYLLFVRDLNSVNDRIDAIQQQLARAGALTANPASGKRKHGAH